MLVAATGADAAGFRSAVRSLQFAALAKFVPLAPVQSNVRVTYWISPKPVAASVPATNPAPATATGLTPVSTYVPGKPPEPWNVSVRVVPLSTALSIVMPLPKSILSPIWTLLIEADRPPPGACRITVSGAPLVKSIDCPDPSVESSCRVAPEAMVMPPVPVIAPRISSRRRWSLPGWRCC